MKCNACGSDHCPCDKGGRCSCPPNCQGCVKKKEGKKVSEPPGVPRP